MEQNISYRPIEILLVEDNPGDAKLAMVGLKESKIKNNLAWVKNGVEAMDYLNKTVEFKDAVRPDLILLDLNMPKKNGTEVLAEIKADDNLKRIPVVILTVSKAEEDILKSYNLHANCFVTKPIDLEQFIHVVQSIEEFWFAIVKLPPNGKGDYQK
jgi:CheY-like chemotaxis protein